MDKDKLLQRIIDLIPQAVFWKDKHYRFLGCNKHFLQLAGLNSVDEIVGKTDFDLSLKDEALRFRQSDMVVIEMSDSILEKEEIHHQKNGKLAYLLTSKVPIFDEDDEVAGVLGTYADITQQKLTQQELIDSKEQLLRINEQLNQELDRAAVIQDQLMPAEAIPCSFLNVDVLKQPLERITGDFFSFRSESEDMYSFVGADIAGHGISASLFTSLLKVTCQRASKKNRYNPAAFMSYLDKEMEGEIPQGFFTAMSFTFSKKRDGTVAFTYCNAAHPALIYYHAESREWSCLHESSFAVGIFSDVERENHRLKLSKGDRLFFYTDGFLEATDQGGDFLGKQRFLRLFKGTENLPLEEVKTFLLDVLNDPHKPYTVSDDLTLVAFEVS